MKTTIAKSKTFKLFTELKEAGFNVTLNSCFTHSYDENNNYFGIFTEDVNIDLHSIFDIVRKYSFDITLQRMAEGNFIYEIRRTVNKKELVIESDWNDYFTSIIS
ncbi:hypothetical protein [Chryseobacterium aquaticum]|uniref:Uncharacterized protein n=1 Tax=Chryseobacterium aquaticum subsp. greenlandense TaxID=345663 RepID=A0A101CHT7_9FLAO|nr:hypothetical protein [Chryseobacterium aquaticum]KUJ56463.1 hypothetical protein AR686_07830 [Chryseobacterium aquaticum subsp. greenlandense]